MKSVNQLAAEATLLEVYKAFHFNITDIKECFEPEKSCRRALNLRTSKDSSSLVSKSAILWNKTDEEFKQHKVNIKTAKRLANKALKKIPMI